jgi:hypothetical protein
MATQSTKTTQLVIQGAPIDPAFEGDLQQLFEHFLERMRIVAPFGISTFVIGTQVPTTDQGPLFLETATGTSLWVWNDEAKTYVPIDISNSQEERVAVQSGQPAIEGDELLWAQTTVEGIPQTLWVKSGGVWYDILNARGNTAGRPSNPAEGTRYWDTDISVELIFERSAWRTLSGSPGDVKYVTHATLSEALRYNPGWVEASTTSSLGPGIRGRSLTAAHKDQGTSPVQDNDAVSGVDTKVAARESFGSESYQLSNQQTPGWPETHFHGTGTFNGPSNDNWFGLTNKDFRAEGFTADRDYATRKIRGQDVSATFDTITKDDVEGTTVGTTTTPPFQESDSYDLPTVTAHENRGPRMALWCLVKE